MESANWDPWHRWCHGWVCLPISQSKARTHSPHTHLPFINKPTFVGLSFSRLSHAHGLQHPPVPFRRLPTYASIILIERYASKESSHRYIDARASVSNQNKGVRDTRCRYTRRDHRVFACNSGA